MNTAGQTELSQIPPHVPAERVFDFDLYNGPAATDDLHGWIASVVDEASGIFFSPRYGGHWVIASHEALAEATRNTEVFSSRKMGIPPSDEEVLQIPISLDPPEHGIYRQILNRPFSPRAIGALEENIRGLAGSLIDQVADKGECEFVEAVAEPLPVMIFMNMMGIPVERLRDFRTWVTDFLGHPERRDAAFANIDRVMVELVEQRQKEPRDDLISLILAGEIDGRPPTMDEMRAFCMLLVIAGLDTVVNGMSFGLHHLARDTESQSRLRDDRSLIPEAVEELLRRYTFTTPGRIVARDVNFQGVDMREGDRVLLLLAAVDLDAAVFPEPLDFDLDRSFKTHVAFNTGPHRCVGSHLARLELRVLYEEWFKRIPAFRLNGPVHFHGGQVFGIDRLHLAWDVRSA